LRAESPVFISVDTSKPEVMRRATEAGADIINDVRALAEPGRARGRGRFACGLCLMHMRGEPRTMQDAPRYDDVVAESRRSSLRASRRVATPAWTTRAWRSIPASDSASASRTISRSSSISADCRGLGAALAVGLSRKSMLAKLTGRAVDDRTAGSVALAAIAVLNGARIVRAHDVAATLDAVRVAGGSRTGRSIRWVVSISVPMACAARWAITR
jgi:dihydropteroate synthase